MDSPNRKKLQVVISQKTTPKKRKAPAGEEGLNKRAVTVFKGKEEVGKVGGKGKDVQKLMDSLESDKDQRARTSAGRRTRDQGDRGMKRAVNTSSRQYPPHVAGGIKGAGKQRKVSTGEEGPDKKTTVPSGKQSSSQPVVAVQNRQMRKLPVGEELSNMRATTSISQQPMSQTVPKTADNSQPWRASIGTGAPSNRATSFMSQQPSQTVVATQSGQKRKVSFGEETSNKRVLTSSGQQPSTCLVLTTKDNPQKRRGSGEAGPVNQSTATLTSHSSSSPLSSLQSKTPPSPDSMRDAATRLPLIQKVIQHNVVVNQREPQGYRQPMPLTQPGATPSRKLRLTFGDGDVEKGEEVRQDPNQGSRGGKSKAFDKNVNTNGEIANLPDRVWQREREEPGGLSSPARRAAAPLQRMWADTAPANQVIRGPLPQPLQQQIQQQSLGGVYPSISQHPQESQYFQTPQYVAQQVQRRQHPHCSPHPQHSLNHQQLQHLPQLHKFSHPQHEHHPQNLKNPKRPQQHTQPVTRPSNPQQQFHHPQNPQQPQRIRCMQQPQQLQRPASQKEPQEQVQNRINMNGAPQLVSQSQVMQRGRPAGQPRLAGPNIIQPSQLPPRPNPPQPPLKPSSNALELFSISTLSLHNAGEDPLTHPTFRLQLKVSSMLRDLKSSISKLPPQKARSDVELMPRQPATPAFGDLALGQLQKAKEFIRPDPPLFSNGIVMRKVEDEDKYHCTFCAYECDFGISDARTWLGADASKGFCKLCLKDGMGFYEDWSISTLSRKVNEDRLEQLDKMCNWPVLGERRRDVVREKEKEKDKGEMVDIEASAPAPRKKRVTSAIDGLDTTHYQGVQFCAGCPWRQVDVMKARICEECKLEKFLIIKHRHQKFLPLVDARPWKKGEPLYWGEKKREVKERNCMVCPRLAMYRCEACPLRLCGDCQAYLELMCKGWLDNLLYLYRNEHIRNDAFLLRSDGGGF